MALNCSAGTARYFRCPDAGVVTFFPFRFTVTGIVFMHPAPVARRDRGLHGMYFIKDYLSPSSNFDILLENESHPVSGSFVEV